MAAAEPDERHPTSVSVQVGIAVGKQSCNILASQLMRLV
jgi:hypothetical protein